MKQAIEWLNEICKTPTPICDLIRRIQDDALAGLKDGCGTPNVNLPPLGDGPRRKMVIEIEVSADFEKRLDNQWMVEREIHADRWSWNWKPEPAEFPVIPNYRPVGGEKHEHLCYCGMAPGDPHPVGVGGCLRIMTAAPEPRPDNRWSVDGHEITDFSLRQQRGYHQHECGCWSRSPGSDNSIKA